MSILTNMIADPDWQKFSPDQQRGIIGKYFARQDEWGQFSPDQQEHILNKAYAKAKIPKTFHYDPAEAERVEPGVTTGLQPSMIQPTDIVAWGGKPIADAMGGVALREGTGLFTRNAIHEGATAAYETIKGLAQQGVAQNVVAPYAHDLFGDGPAGEFAQNLTGDVAGVAPFVRGGIGTKSLTSKFLAKPEMEKVAQDAAEGAEQENAAAKAKLQKAAQGERAAQKTAAAKAAQGALETQAQTVAQAAQDVETRNAAQASMNAARQTAETKAADATVKLQESAAQELVPEAKQAAVNAAAGNPPSPTMPQGPARIVRDAEFRGTMTAPLTKWRQDWGTRRTDLLKPYMGNKPELGQVQGAAQKELSEWQQGRRAFSPKVQAMLQDATQWGVAAGPTDEELLMEAGYPKKEIPAVIARAGENEKSSASQILAQLRAEHGGTEAEAPTVADLLSKQAEANKVAMSSKGADRTAMRVLSHSIDESLASVAPTKELQALNAEYRDHRQSFPYDFEDTINGSARPLDVAPEIFRYPQRAVDLADLGDDSTRKAMGQLYAQWVGEEGPRVIDPSQAPALAKMFPGTPLADPNSWVYLDKSEAKLGDVLDSSPQVKAKWQAAVNKGGQKIARDYANSMVSAALKDAKNYGPLGDQLITQIRLAKTPEDAANLVAKFYNNLTPEDATAAMSKALQGTPTAGQAASTAVAAAPHEARQALANFQPQDPEAAAVKALQERGYKPTKLWQMLKTRSIFWAPMVGGALAYGGTPSHYALFGLTAGIPIGARELLVRSFQNSLAESPEAATAFYRAMQKPAEGSNFNLLASAAARAGIGSAIEKAGGDAATVLQSGKTDTSDIPTYPIPDPREKAPLPTLDVAWHNARASKDDKQAKEIRNIVIRRMQAGEWKSLPPDQKKQLAPFIRELGGATA